MTDMKFEVKITAVAEIRDKDGNLISAEPVEFTPQIVSEAVARELIEGEQA